MQKQIFKIFFLLAMFFAVPNFVLAARSINLGVYALGTTCDGAYANGCWGGLNANTFMLNNFDIWVGGPSWVYRDFSVNEGITGNDYFALKTWAKNNAVDAEEMLVHAKQDYALSQASFSVGNAAFSKMDAFDNFEGENGILETTDDATYSQLNAPFATNPYALNATLGNTVYFGYEEPFAQINFVFSTKGAGISDVWEYWNGSNWSALNVTDGTNNFSSDGQISFLPPSDWTRTVVNNSNSKYFVRVRFTGGTQFPITTSIKGDDWLNGGPFNCRGWNPADPNIINTGELSFNPNAGTGVSATSHATFRYQSRIPDWASNYFLYDPADKQMINGTLQRTESKLHADWVIAYHAAHPATIGVMGDDAILSLPATVPYAQTDFADKTTNTFAQEQLNKYSDILTDVHADSAMNNFKVGINDKSRSASKLGDFDLQEYSAYVPGIDADAGYRNILTTDSPSGMTYDDYLPQNNPLGTEGLFIYADNADTFQPYADYPTTNNKISAPWDRSNRGPMTVLSRFLVAANPKTYLAYVTGGDFIYNGGHVGGSSYTYGGRDGVWLNDGTFTYLSKTNFVMPDVSLVKHWETYFPAMGVDFGVPDPNGYNGGARDLVWKSGLDLDWADGSDLQENNLSASSVDINADTLTTANNWPTARGMRFKGTNLPAPLALSTTYYAINVDATHIKLATTSANAKAGTAINLTTVGSGNFTAHYIPYTATNVYPPDVWRRDYTNAIVLHRTHSWATIADEFATYSAPIDLGGTYYLLDATGKTGPAITSISLRANEGAILMKAPIGNDVTAPSAPSGLSVQ